MRIAVASCGLEIAPCFSQCLNFNYYTTKSCEIVDSQNIPAQGLSGTEYAKLMDSIDVDTLICGSIPPATREAFEAYGIGIVAGAQGNALKAAEYYVANRAQEVLADTDEETEDC
jgi:predicted Fe-Mo cluster-binding NifX family protein